MIRYLALLIIGIIGLVASATPANTYAADLFPDKAICDKTPNAAVCKDKTTRDPLSGDDGVIVKIAQIVAYIAGGVAVIVILIGGIYFITANGDANKISSARSAVINTLIGLIVVVLAQAIIIFVVRRLDL
jgi:hypothetical protein